MNIGDAFENIKKGIPMYRENWNGKDLFIFKQIPVYIGKDVISGMQSLPNKIKDIILSRKNPILKYANQMCIVNAEGRVDSWVPSSSDLFAEDWKIFELK